MTVWQQTPLTPSETGQTGYNWYADLPEDRLQVPTSETPDRRGIGSARSRRPPLLPNSPTPSNGSRVNLSEETPDTNIGRFVSPLPPNSLLQRLENASQEMDTMNLQDQAQQNNTSGRKTPELGSSSSSEQSDFD